MTAYVVLVDDRVAQDESVRWWGAPGYPAKATAFEMRQGGKVEFP